MEPNLKKGIGEETDSTDNIFPTKILALNNTTPVCVYERETERERRDRKENRYIFGEKITHWWYLTPMGFILTCGNSKAKAALALLLVPFSNSTERESDNMNIKTI